MLEQKYTIQELENALARNEFLYFYQPILSLETGEIAGGEALIRWQKDNSELVLPGDFIPFAEESGFITKITQNMISSFLDDLKYIKQINNELFLSINLSAKDLVDGAFNRVLLHSMNETGIDSININLELTESSALSLSNKAILDIAELKANGIELSIDDFGTGYATFKQLSNLPFENLKIDYSITAGAMSTPDNLTLLDHSINLAHQLDMWSVAEGVENTSILKYLMYTGCDYAQGFKISKPLELSAFLDFIKSGKKWTTCVEGQVYKSMIDYTDWIRKVTATLNMQSKNVRIVPYEAEDTPTAKFLNHCTKNNLLEKRVLDDVLLSHNKSVEVAKFMLNAKGSGDANTVRNLMPEFFDLCHVVYDQLNKLYFKGLQEGFTEGKDDTE